MQLNMFFFFLFIGGFLINVVLFCIVMVFKQSEAYTHCIHC